MMTYKKEQVYSIRNRLVWVPTAIHELSVFGHYSEHSFQVLKLYKENDFHNTELNI